MTLNEFLKHVYHTRLYIVIPVLGRAKLDKRDFLTRRGRLDNNKLHKHLCKLYENKFNNKHEKNMK